MDEPNWAKVLSVLHESQRGSPFPDVTSGRVIELSEHISKQTDMDEREIENALDYLKRVGLIESVGTTDEEHVFGGLTEEGFRIAHERELREQQYELAKTQSDANETLADFTIILGVTALIQALAAVVAVPQYTLYLGTIYLILLASLMYKRDEWFHN